MPKSTLYRLIWPDSGCGCTAAGKRAASRQTFYKIYKFFQYRCKICTNTCNIFIEFRGSCKVDQAGGERDLSRSISLEEPVQSVYQGGNYEYIWRMAGSRSAAEKYMWAVTGK